jgi:hypothetical protein
MSEPIRWHFRPDAPDVYDIVYVPVANGAQWLRLNPKTNVYEVWEPSASKLEDTR